MGLPSAESGKAFFRAIAKFCGQQPAGKKRKNKQFCCSYKTENGIHSVQGEMKFPNILLDGVSRAKQF